jgi:hypothetical protein
MCNDPEYSTGTYMYSGHAAIEIIIRNGHERDIQNAWPFSCARIINCSSSISIVMTIMITIMITHVWRCAREESDVGRKRYVRDMVLLHKQLNLGASKDNTHRPTPLRSIASPCVGENTRVYLCDSTSVVFPGSAPPRRESDPPSSRARRS